ncbi:PD-(D/E)XK nuclease family protein [Winogradskyella litoriviva]|uniref:PD-(D/E)XK nuclease family protein n=1 Tax=Winogradskyella litoriviva TaxID=1220182 RepID=A0ABX2E4P8_9FLAO|nr:PD-(D/E)XK nuclease family protein [Winogradskyella litoriviva]NRD22706.1 PD-(D/E)XK nuclease family protein [Winogradskyella litoriviva]
MPNQPNIFNYATSELSQDAFIAWLLSWSDAKYKAVNEPLHQLSLKFLESLLTKQSIQLNEISDLKIKTQFHKIDVFVSFIMDSKSYGVIIEDKVHTIEHNNQLARYVNKVKELNSETIIVPIYFKTGYQVNLTRVKENKYHHYTVKDLLKVLKKDNVAQISNDVLTQYHGYILEKEKEYDNADEDANAYVTAPLKDWNWWTCSRFFHEYKNHFNAGWGSVGNKREALLAFWYGGSKFSIRDVESGKLLNLEIYSDVQFSRGRIIISYRIGLKDIEQKNNKNRNKIYGAFKPYLDNENIVHKKAHFKPAKKTIKLVEIKDIDHNMCYKDVVLLLKKIKSISQKFTQEYKDA